MKKKIFDQKFDIRDFLEGAGHKGQITVEQERALLRKAYEASDKNSTNGGRGGRGGRGRGDRGRGGRGGRGGKDFVSNQDSGYQKKEVGSDNKDGVDVNPEEKKGQENEMIYLEDIHQSKQDTMNDQTEKQFFTKLENVMKFNAVDEIEKLIGKYRREHINGTKLFDGFEKVMGKALAFKYFPMYVKTIQNFKTAEELDQVLYEKAMAQPSRNNCVQFGNESYSDLFNKMTRYISENVFQRIKTKRMDDSKPIYLDQTRMFQMIGSLRAQDPKEIIKFNFLSNFLRNQVSKQHISDMMFVDIDKIDETLNKIENEDILICFLYFNLSGSKLSGKYIKNSKEDINPNLIKTFQRHFPNFAKENNYKIESDDEDYKIENQVKAKKKYSDKNPGIFVKSDNIKPVQSKKSAEIKEKEMRKYEMENAEKRKMAASNTNNLKIENVFVANDNEVEKYKEEHFDPKNVYEFPQIGGNDEQSLHSKNSKNVTFFCYKKKTKEKKDKGWGGASGQFIYKNEQMSTKVMNEEFPDLGGMGGLGAPAPKPELDLKKKPVSMPSSNYQYQAKQPEMSQPNDPFYPELGGPPKGIIYLSLKNFRKEPLGRSPQSS